MFLLDTNVLMNYPEILEGATKEYIITNIVIQELDYKKESRDPSTAYKARKATHFILKYYDNITIEYIENTNIENDDKLVKYAKEHNYTLLTSDLILCLKCKIDNVDYIYYDKDTEAYTGIIYYTINLDENNYSEILELMFEEGMIPEDIKLVENQFLIAVDKNDNTLAIFVCRNGKLNVVKNYYIRNDYVGDIAPRNREQSCLCSLLKDKNITILSAQGGYGTGKSFLTINYALQELERDHINQIVFVPNNAFTSDTREIGALPGTLYEKELLFMGTIVDIIGEFMVTKLIEESKLIVAPISAIRGRNFDNSIIIVNEAENLTEEHIKLLIGRVGHDSKIIFDGDIDQADSSTFKNKNGMKFLSKLKNSPIFSKLFGSIRLVKVERSLTAQAADYLDKC